MAAEPDHPGAAHYIIHGYDYPTLAPARPRRRAPLRQVRAGGAACAAHALTHLRAARHVAGDDPGQYHRGGGREEPRQSGRPHARARLPGLRVPAAGAGRGGQEGARGGPGHHGRPRRTEGRIRAPHRALRHRRHGSALGDGARAMAGGRQHRAAAEPLCPHRVDDLLRARHRRGAHGQSGPGPDRCRQDRDPSRRAPAGQEHVLGRAGGDPAAGGGGMGRARRGQERRGPPPDALGRRAGGSHREAQHHAGADRHGARAVRRSPDGHGPARAGRARVRGVAQARPRPLQGASRRGPRRRAGGGPGDGQELLRPAGDRGGARRHPAPGAGPGQSVPGSK